MVQKQAILTAAHLPGFDALLGIKLLPLLVYALQETASGTSNLPKKSMPTTYSASSASYLHLTCRIVDSRLQLQDTVREAEQADQSNV